MTKGEGPEEVHTMAKFTSFTMTPQGELAYSNTGRLAPSSYTVRGNTVYGADNRKIGNVRKLENLKKAQRDKVVNASRSRQHARARAIKNAGKPRQSRPKRPSGKAAAGGQQGGHQGRDPDVPPSEEYYREYANTIHEYARALRDPWAREILMNATLEDCEMLHALAYDVYEAFIQYGDDAVHGTLTPMQRRSFERVGARLASLLRAIRGGTFREEMGRNGR